MGILKEFKEFAAKGNVIDLAVGLVIGAAFGKIVTSAVSDVIMPPIGLLVGGINFTDIKLTLKQAVVNAAGKVTSPAVTLNLGNFLQTVFDFLIIAFAVFLVVKAANQIKKKETETPSPDPELTTQEKLLVEIRDLLRKNPTL